MSDFDKASRYAARRLDGPGPLRWLSATARAGRRRGVVGPEWSFDGWVDSQTVPFPGEPDRRCDTIARYLHQTGAGPPLALVVEFLSSPRDVLARQAQYQLAVHEELPYQPSGPVVRYAVTGLVVCLTGRMPGRWAMTPPDTGGLSLSLQVGVLNLEEVRAGPVLAQVRAGQVPRSVLAWAPLWAGADASRVIAAWRRLVMAEPDERLRADLVGLARTFSGLVEHGAAWRQALEGMNMERSPFLLEVEARGKVLARQADILEILGVRLGRPLPEWLVGAVQQQTDPAILARWLLGCIGVTTLDEASQILGLPAWG